MRIAVAVAMAGLSASTMIPGAGAAAPGDTKGQHQAIAFARQHCESPLPANNGCEHDILVSVGGEVSELRAMPGLNEVEPTFSGDGTRVAYAAWDADVIASQVWVADVTTGATYPLTRGDHFWDDGPDWSPTDNVVAFTRNTLKKNPGPNDRAANLLANSDLWLATEVAPDVWVESLLISQPGGEGAPDFSPDGTKLVYPQDYDDDDNHQRSDWLAAEIWVINVDGSDPVRLTRSPLHEARPAWSPDGRQIVFSRGLGGNPVRAESPMNLWIMNADGTRMRRITRGPVVDGPAAWSEDGKSLVFQRCPILEPGAWPWPDCAILEIDVANPERVTTVVDEPGAYDGDPEPFST